MMLIRADPRTKTISLLSFPRDLDVPIYCGADADHGLDRINSAYSRCGSKGTVLTIKHLTALPINYLITVNFHGFKEVVDKLGGVWMDVDRRYYNKNTGASYDNYANIDLQPGYQRLDGEQALDFVRFRHTDSDLYRLARQQEFVRAFKEQVAHNFSLTSLPSSSTRSRTTSRSARAVTSCRAARSSRTRSSRRAAGWAPLPAEDRGRAGASVTCAHRRATSSRRSTSSRTPTCSRRRRRTQPRSARS